MGSKPHTIVPRRTSSGGCSRNMWQFLFVCLAVAVISVQASTIKQLSEDNDIVFEDIQSTNKLNTPAQLKLISEPAKALFDDILSDDHVSADDNTANSPRLDLTQDTTDDDGVELASDDEEDDTEVVDDAVATVGTGNWLSNGVKRLKREVNRLLGRQNSETKPSATKKTRKGKKNGKGKKGHGKKAGKVENSQVLTTKSLGRRGPVDVRPKRQFPTDDEDDFNTGSGYGAPTEQLLRLSFTIEEVYDQRFADRSSDRFNEVASSLARGIEELYTRENPTLPKIYAQVIKIGELSTPLQLLIVADVRTPHDVRLDVIRKMILDQIRNYHTIGEYTVPSDDQFSLRPLEGAPHDPAVPESPTEPKSEDPYAPEFHPPSSSGSEGEQQTPRPYETPTPSTTSSSFGGDDDYETTPTDEFGTDLGGVDEAPFHKEHITPLEEGSQGSKCRGDDIYICPYSRVEICEVQRCDGHPDCPDYEDEDNCPRECETDEFSCDTNRCIPNSQVCDGVNNCSDGKDEQGCSKPEPEPQACAPSEYQCHDGRCLPAQYRCNGHPECTDGDDEQDCPIRRTCDMYTDFACISGECIPKEQHCDGSHQCIDGSDEINCITTPVPKHQIIPLPHLEANCTADEFACFNGECLHRTAVCDSVADCSHSEDESDQICKCAEHEFKCLRGGGCLQKSLLCDGRNHCYDASDENECHSDCTDEEFQCDGNLCIPIEDRCNGIRNCGDSTDELNCTSCSIDSFHCHNDMCVPESARCDGRYDCSDYSDEENCGCSASQFKCSDGSCIESSARCNGRRDCADESDEAGCPSRPEPSYCSEREWKCGNGQCIPNYLHCDGRPDCSDYSDEADCEPTPPPAGVDPQLSLKTYPNEQIIKESREVVFRCRDEGPSRARVKWSRPNGQPLPAGSRDEKGRLEIPNIQVSDSGEYICEATDYPGHTQGQRVSVHLTVEKYITPRPATACAYHEATCMNGECISKFQICDGIAHCTDGSDEHACSRGQKCNPDQFLCKNSKCVDRLWRCDGEDDCGDRSDEESCDPNPTGSPCHYDEYQCKTGQCVPKSFHCDGRSDCSDGSDEVGCMAPSIVSPPPPLVSVPVGGAFNISCRAVGVPTPLVLFRLNWGHIPENCVTSNSDGYGYLECNNMQIAQAGAYSCEVINIKGRIFVTPDTIVTVLKDGDVCPAGTFNSLANREEECISCFCFGISSQCSSADLFTYALPPPIRSHNVVGLNIQPGGLGDYQVGSYSGHDLINLRHGVQFRASDIPYTREIPYLSLPADYQGSQLKSYGGYLKYDVQYVGSGTPNSAPDLVLIGNGITLVHRAGYSVRPNTPNKVSVQFTPGPWYMSNGQPASREHIMMSLADVQHILIKLQYIDSAERQVEVTSISMDSAAVDDRGLGSASLVEQCVCPPGYSGFSCEKCAPGFERKKQGSWLGVCLPEEPEYCPPGTYGNPSRGIQCRPCPCPFASGGNYFARSCSLGADNEPICHCLKGYVGRRCESCDAGYEGYPNQPGGQCQPARHSHCDERGTTRVGPDGACECKSNTAGQYCDQCAANSFNLNNMTASGCIDCFCMGVTKECSSSTMYRDSIRSRMQGGYGHGFSLITNYENPSPQQSTYDITQSGRELSFRGRYEDHDVQFWSLPNEFLGNQLGSYGGYLTYIVRYNPYESGAMSRNSAPDVVIKSSNDIVIVHYRKDYVSPTGPQTYRAPIREDEWQRLDGNAVNREHLLMALADVSAIFIKGTYTTVTEEAAISGVTLDTAAPRNTGNDRALEVEECRCPNEYTGLSCEDCAPGYKRSDQGLYLGICEPCECNGHSNECDPETGKCLNCRDNTAGDDCGQCAPGFTGDALAGPRGCMPDSPGSSTLCNQCDERGTISCSNGYCQCKENVQGSRCNECREGTFDLSASNRKGCSECFCSGVSRTCYSSTLHREQMGVFFAVDKLALADHNGQIRVSDEISTDIERNEASYSIPDNRMYFWRLPDKLLSNQIKSYGGNLQFVVESDGYGSYVPDQDVILRGNGRTLVWSRPRGSEEESLVTVKIHESDNWQRVERVGIQPSTREDFLVVLSNLEQILVRATLKSPTTGSRIRDIILDTALSEGASPASEVEMCVCPPGYSGLSCESCDGLTYRNASGLCSPCPCNAEGTESCSVIPSGHIECHCQNGYVGGRCEYSGGQPPQPPQPPTQPPQATINVIITSPPLLRIIESGQSVSLDCSGQVIATRIPLTVTWMKMDGQLPRDSYEERGRLYMQNLQEYDSGIYVCQARRGPEVAEQKVTITVGSPTLTIPKVTIEPPYQTFAEHSPADIYCEVSGSPEPAITWTKISDRISPYARQEGLYLRFDSITKSDEGSYQCNAQNSAGTNDAVVQIYVTGDRSPQPPQQPDRRPQPPQQPDRRPQPPQQPDNRPQPPHVLIEPPSFYGRTGDEVRLMCMVDDQNVIYTWRKDNSDIYSGHIVVRGNSLVISGATARDSGEYVCTATNPSTGMSSTGRSQVLVEDVPSGSPPKIVPLIEDYTLIQGQDFSITCEASGSPHPTIKWTKLHENLDSNVQQNGNALRFMNAQPANRGVYICIAESAAGTEQTSTRVEVEPRERPVLEVHPREPQKVRIGESAMMSCRAIAGIPEPKISWKRIDGKPLSYKIKELYPGTITLNEVTADEAGEYECSAENAAGRATTVAVIVVQQAPEIRIDPSEEELMLTEGEELKLTCTASGSPIPSVTWEWDSTPVRGSAFSQTEGIGESVLQSYQITMNDARVYTCTASNEAGTDRKYISVIVKKRRGDTGIYDIDSPITPAPGQPSYRPQPTQYPPYSRPQPQPQPTHYPSYPQPQPNPQPTQYPSYPSQPTQYPSYPEQPYAPPAPYNPSQPDYPSTTLQPYKVGVGDRATLMCNIEGSDARTSWSRVDGRPMPRNHIITENSLIIEDVNFDAAGFYQCSVMDRYGSRPLVTAELIVINIPRITFSPSMPMIVRTGENVAIFCNATGEQPIRVQWHAENHRPLAPSVRVDGYYLRFKYITPADAGRYYCSAANAHGNATKVAEVLVNRGAIVDRPPTSNTHEVYEGDSVALKCALPMNRFEPGMKFNWRFNDRPLSFGYDVSNATLILRSISQYNTGRYVCEIISQNGDIIAENDVNVVLKTPDAPSLRLNPSRAYLRTGESTVVECISQPSDYASLVWERADGRPLPENVRQEGNKLYLDNVQLTDTGEYICRCRTPYNHEYSTNYELNITPQEEENYKRQTRQSEVQHADVGSTVVLKCDVKAFPASFKWSRQHGKFNPGQDINAPTLNLTNIQAKDAGSYICSVSHNGKSSDTATTLVVTGAIPYFPQARKSYMTFPTLQNAYMKFNFEITFRPEHENGLILYNGQKRGSGDYIALSLNDRYPEFRFDFGNKPTTIRSEEPIKLGEWHTIKVNRVRKDGLMMVDNQRPVAFPPVSQSVGLDLIENMYLGGVPTWEDIPAKAVAKQEGFVGCISRLVLKDKMVELNQDALFKEGTTACEPCADDPCQNDGVCLESQTEVGYSCICQDGYTGKNCALEGSSCAPGICGIGRCENTDIGMECYCPLNRTGDRCQYIEHLDEGSLSFKDGSYAAYKTPKSSKIDIKFNIRPDNIEDSVILYVSESEQSNGDFVALIIKDKHLELRLYVSAHLKPLIIRSQSPLVPRKWTQVHITRKMGVVHLKVGNEPIQSGRTDGPVRSVYLKTYLYIGGYDKRINLNKHVGVTRGFDGCISKLQEGVESIDLIANVLDAANVQNCGDSNEISNQPPPPSNENSIETHADACSRDPCENHGTCIPHKDDYKCECAVGFAGKSCEKMVRILNSAHFNGNGYIELDRKAFSNSTDEEKNFVAILFSTIEPNGLLIWHGQEKGQAYNGQDFLALAIVDGFLEYNYRLDGQESSTKHYDVRVNDGKRHVAIIRREQNRAGLELDSLVQRGETRPTPQTKAHLPGNLFIGGTPDQDNFTGHRFTHGFVGCILAIENEVDGSINLLASAVSSMDADECPDESEMDLGTEPPVV